MAVEQEVSAHYGAFGQREPIMAALAKRGIDPAKVTPDDLAPFDQFHTGGALATREMVQLLAPAPGAHILDVGCGLGGPARMLARLKDCAVTGLDLAPHFIENAKFFTEMTMQADRVSFHQGSATAMPFVDASFDGAWHLHMCMNVPDKKSMYAEIARVLKPGARFVMHDPVRGEVGEVMFPVPWAATPDLSFLVARAVLLDHLKASGFAVISEKDATAEGIAYYEKLEASRPKPDPSKPTKPPAPLEIMQKNHRANLAAGAVRIHSLVAEKRA